MLVLRIGFIIFFVLLLIVILLLLNRHRVDTYLYKKELEARARNQKEEIKRIELLIAHEEEALENSVNEAEQYRLLKDIEKLKEDIKHIEER